MPAKHTRRAKPKIVIPASTPGCTVFTYEWVNKKFKTAHYTQSLTQGRVTHTEIDQLLEKVSVPVAGWFQDYGMTPQRKRMFFWMRLICTILLPLIVFYFCYRAFRKRKATARLRELRKNVIHLINTNGHSYVQRHLVWHIPPHFPFYIELKDKTHPSYVPAGKAGVRQVHPQLQPQVYPMQGGYSQPNMGIQMMPMQQQPGYGYPGYQMQPGYMQPGYQMQPGYMAPYSPSGYPLMQGGGYQQPGAVSYGVNYYS